MIDIQTYRQRIGCFNQSNSLRNSKGDRLGGIIGANICEYNLPHGVRLMYLLYLIFKAPLRVANESEISTIYHRYDTFD
jgi:hypothetical protein